MISLFTSQFTHYVFSGASHAEIPVANDVRTGVSAGIYIYYRCAIAYILLWVVVSLAYVAGPFLKKASHHR